MVMIDMDMPKNCKECPLKRYSVMSYALTCVLKPSIHFYQTDEGRHRECPLIPLGKEEKNDTA